jgi:hypothetical protein
MKFRDGNGGYDENSGTANRFTPILNITFSVPRYGGGGGVSLNPEPREWCMVYCEGGA